MPILHNLHEIEPNPPLHATELEALCNSVFYEWTLMPVLLSHANAPLTMSSWTSVHSSQTTVNACVTTSIKCYNYANVIEQKVAFIAKLIRSRTNNSNEAAAAARIPNRCLWICGSQTISKQQILNGIYKHIIFKDTLVDHRLFTLIQSNVRVNWKTSVCHHWGMS